jgi:hypothetical protein
MKSSFESTKTGYAKKLFTSLNRISEAFSTTHHERPTANRLAFRMQVIITKVSSIYACNEMNGAPKIS